jgi:uncharacterized protein (TIGR03067 family)
MARSLRLSLFAVAFLGFMLSSGKLTAEPTADATRAELKKLAGTWEGYVVEGEGENPDRGPVHLRVTITDSKIEAVDLDQGEKEMGSGTFQIDPTKMTREIDATGVILPGKRERTFQGIYALDGDTLKWCVDNRSQDRPSEFRTEKGKYLLILKRKK